MFVRDRRAASAVEFAMIAPFLLLLIAAVMAYGSLFATSLSLQQLAAETARATIGGLNDAERKTLAEQYFAGSSGNYPLLNAANVSLDFSDADDASLSRVTLNYDLSDHPAYAFESLLPLPASPLSYELVISDGDGATS